MSNKIRALIYEVKGSEKPARRCVGDSFPVITSEGTIQITISRIHEEFNPINGETDYLFYAKNQHGEEGLWKKKNRFFEVEYDVIDLWKP